MDWVKLAVRFYADPRVAALSSSDVELMFVRGLARAGEVGQAGFIPEASLPELARRRRYAALVEELVSSGLWTRVPGGVQVTGWDHWQDGLDTLARRRATDRERQRRRRAAAAGAPAEPTSRDLSRDVTPAEGEEEREKEGGRPRGVTHPARVDAEPPTQTCDQHPDGTEQPCRACERHRKRHEQWERDQAAQQAADVAEQRWAWRNGWRCGRCGIRNPADEEKCQQCGEAADVT